MAFFQDGEQPTEEELAQEATKALDDKKLEVRQFESQLAVAKTHAKMPPKVLTQRLFPKFSELQLWEDGVSTTSRHRDAVDAAAARRSIPRRSR